MESQRIRNNLLNKVGITPLQYERRQRNEREPSRGSLLGNVPVTKEPLKYQVEEDHRNNFLMNLFSGTPSSVDSESSASSQRSTSRLTFSEDVDVVPIPQRTEYSKRVKSRMWSSPEEIQVNAQRNAVEFMAEGWDWKSAVEDDCMYRCTVTGEKIHPIHCVDELYDEQAAFQGME